MPSIKERISALENKNRSDSTECRTSAIDCGVRSTSSSRPLSAPAVSSISEKIKALNAGHKSSTGFEEAPSSKENPASPKSKPKPTAALRTCSNDQSQTRNNKDFLSSPGKVELSAVETLLEVNQKKGEMDEPTGVSIIKSECDVLDEEKEQLQEASAVTEEEMRLMDGSAGLSASMRKMIDVANSEHPPQVDDDEGTAVVVDTPPSQTVAQAPSPSSPSRLDAQSGRMSSGIAARVGKIKTALSPPEPTRKQLLHFNNPPHRGISTTLGSSESLESPQQSRPLSIGDRIKMGGGIGLPLPAFGGGPYSPATCATSCSTDTTVTKMNEEDTGPGNDMSHCQLDRPVQPRKRPPKKKTAFKPVSIP